LRLRKKGAAPVGGAEIDINRSEQTVCEGHEFCVSEFTAVVHGQLVGDEGSVAVLAMRWITQSLIRWRFGQQRLKYSALSIASSQGLVKVKSPASAASMVLRSFVL